MFGPANICGCELGGDCTKTTVCAIESALEDQADEIERLREALRDAQDQWSMWMDEAGNASEVELKLYYENLKVLEGGDE